MTTPTVLGEQLRLRTKELHLQLEQTAVARHLMSTTLTVAAYVDILQVWGTAWNELETALWTTHFALQVPNLLPARRSAKANIDLRYLAAQHAIVASRRVEKNDRAVAPPLTLASFVGVCYVLRGASLGGKVIARHLALTLGLTASHGAAFFAAGEEGGTWREWLQHADALIQNQHDIDQAVNSATTTFTFLRQQFSYAAEPLQT